MCAQHFLLFLFVKSGDFKRIGILVGMSLVNGGSGFPYFAPALYSYISGQEVQSIVITVDEVPNAELHSVLVKVICVAWYNDAIGVHILCKDKHI